MVSSRVSLLRIQQFEPHSKRRSKDSQLPIRPTRPTNTNQEQPTLNVHARGYIVPTLFPIVLSPLRSRLALFSVSVGWYVCQHSLLTLLNSTLLYSASLRHLRLAQNNSALNPTNNQQSDQTRPTHTTTLSSDIKRTHSRATAPISTTLVGHSTTHRSTALARSFGSFLRFSSFNRRQPRDCLFFHSLLSLSLFLSTMLCETNLADFVTELCLGFICGLSGVVTVRRYLRLVWIQSASSSRSRSSLISSSNSSVISSISHTSTVAPSPNRAATMSATSSNRNQTVPITPRQEKHSHQQMHSAQSQSRHHRYERHAMVARGDGKFRSANSLTQLEHKLNAYPASCRTRIAHLCLCVSVTRRAGCCVLFVCKLHSLSRSDSPLLQSRTFLSIRRITIRGGFVQVITLCDTLPYRIHSHHHLLRRVSHLLVLE